MLPFCLIFFTFAVDMEEKHLYIIATGGCGQETTINNEVEYQTIETYVKHRT